jgi:hypothetical protein
MMGHVSGSWPALRAGLTRAIDDAPRTVAEVLAEQVFKQVVFDMECVDRLLPTHAGNSRGR